MAKYRKPHIRPLISPPEVGITVSGGYNIASPGAAHKCNVFRIGFAVPTKTDEDQLHELELSREEANMLISELKRYLDMNLR